MDSFNSVTAKLQASHESLRGEVARLNRELSEANAALERSRRLAALGEMAAGIAHEVRNPVGGIRLYARLLDQDLSELPRQRETWGLATDEVEEVRLALGKKYAPG
jgi:signal transduction histidine kinase